MQGESDEDHPLLTALVKTALILAIVALGAGYLGWLHPAGDALSVGRGVASAAVFILAVAGVFVGMRLAAFGAILFSLLTLTSVILAYVWPGPPGTFALYQKNMYRANDDLAGLEADIRAADPLALTLQEVSEANLPLMTALQDLLPHQLRCTEEPRPYTAIATRLEPVPGTERCGPGLAAMQVIYDDEPVWLVSVHLTWPWPYGQAAHAHEIAPLLAALEGPVLMGGDFNMVRWGQSVQRLAAAARVKVAGPMRGTYLSFGPLLSLPIDYTFAPNGGRVEFRPALGSDHLGLFTMLAL